MKPIFAPALCAFLFVLSCAMNKAPTESNQGATHLTAQPMKPPDAPPDLLLVLVGGLRADFGVPQILESGIRANTVPEHIPMARFQNTYVQSTIPLVSLGTVLTSRYPAAIPLCGLISRLPSDQAEHPWCTELPDMYTTLPELLAIYGYKTAIFHAGISGASLITDGFAEAEDCTVSWQSSQTDWNRVTQSAESWWRDNSGHPRLLVVVTSDLNLSFRKDLVQRMGIPISEAIQLRHHGPWPSEKIAEVYQGEVGQLAESIGGLMTGLHRLGSTTLTTVVGGLNGASLGESTGVGPIPRIFTFHDIPLERTSHVPLLVYGPDNTDTIDIATPTELIDVLPTMAWWANAVVPQHAQGTNLLLRATNPYAEGMAYTETGDTLQLRQGQYLYMFRNVRHHMSTIDPRLTAALNNPRGLIITQGLWNIEDDSAQLKNIISQERSKATRLKQSIKRIRNERATPPPDYIHTDELLEMHLTKAEGYW